MTSDNQKSVNQLVQEAVDLVAAATKSAAYAHADAVTTATLAHAADPSGRSAILLHAARAKEEAFAALGCVNRVQDALQRLERRLAQTVSGPKQSDDGWIEWAGGDCPVAEDAVVDLRFRSGRQRTFSKPHLCRWRFGTEPRHYDIVAYRVHKADPAPQDATDWHRRYNELAASYKEADARAHSLRSALLDAVSKHATRMAEAEAEIARLRAEVETQKREHEGLREWSADQADQILELIDAHNEAAAQYNEAQAECEALKRENAERKLSELQAAHEALQQAHQDAVQQLASRNNEIANLRKLIGWQGC